MATVTLTSDISLSKFCLVVTRSEQRPQREDAGATVLDEQMRSSAPRYPVDRYLVESSNKFEMVNIIDDEIWNTEPALRPEDEIILRKLHEMLQSTADDLKLLSGELSKYHEPGVQVKTAPTPLDEEFNEKVHIEELVNAKFHGYEIIEKPPQIPEVKLRNDTIDGKNVNRTKILNTDVKAKAAPVTKRPVINKKLAISRTRIMQIVGKDHNSSNKEVLNNGKIMNSAPAVAYNEFSFKYTEPKINDSSRILLQVQDMPSINIRGELKEQKVLQLDIVPENKETKELNISKSNVSVVTMTHETATKHVPDKVRECVHYPKTDVSNQTIRKISKLSTCESSESTNNVSSDTKTQQITQKRIVSTMRNSPKTSARNKKSANIKQESYKHSRFNIDEWKKKLNVVYGPSCSKKTKQGSKKASPKKSNLNQKQNVFNNAQYIPYSQLTLGGVRVSDIERELSNIPKNIDMPLSPILDKIISSRENSFYKDSSTKHQIKESPRILTTSDENLLQEVIDIERSVSETLSKSNLKKKENGPILETQNKLTGSDDESDENESYADDFEDEKSEHTGRPENEILVSPSESNEKYDKPQHEIREVSSDNNNNGGISNIVSGPSHGIKDKTFTKSFNLSYKDSVDIFEFIHSVDTQDIAVQSNETEKITPKETQTTPRNDKPNIQPIHNDLWPSIDPRREVEKMFELEKEFIKKLILDEYGDILEKSINKPSTSNENRIEESKRNIGAAQKNTQTSPAHVKSVMTSPKLTKTRTTSPFLLTVPVHQQTSPMIFVTNDNAQEQNPTHIVDRTGTEADDISVNLSSPRFSLRLPQTSREVLSNLDHSRSQKKTCLKREDKHINRTFTKTTKTSSSSAEADKSSSDMSSLGEIKIKRRLKKKVSSISEYSSSSTVSKYSYEMQSVGILPLRSEGEVSIGQARSELRKTSKSDGETSFGRLK